MGIAEHAGGHVGDQPKPFATAMLIMAEASIESARASR